MVFQLTETKLELNFVIFLNVYLSSPSSGSMPNRLAKGTEVGISISSLGDGGYSVIASLTALSELDGRRKCFI